MSQHILMTTHKDRPLRVMMGYDRPLGHYFMVLAYQDEIPDPPEDDEEEWDDGTLYSNLYDPEAGFAGDLTRYQAVLIEQGIVVPESMMNNVLEDGANNVGNRVVYYESDGSFTEPHKFD